MPYFDQNPLEKLALQATEAEASLDLRGQAPEQALRAVEQLLRQAPPGKSFLIQFDPASGDGHETRRMSGTLSANPRRRCLFHSFRRLSSVAGCHSESCAAASILPCSRTDLGARSINSQDSAYSSARR